MKLVQTGLKREACLIDGQWVTSDAWTDVTNPANGIWIGRVPKLGSRDAARAIAAAKAAMPAWAARSADQRSAVLRRFHDLMIANQDALARLLTEEQGKPLGEAKAEILYAAGYIEWFAEEARRVYGDIIPAPNTNTRTVVLKQPIGVVAAITPWNFPAAMIARKIGPALAAGCAVVLKPAPQTPFSALALGVLAEQAGLPAGVLNILTGDAVTIGEEFTSNRDVAKISFTGSTNVGALLFAQSAPTIKKLSLELGGNAPFIVFDDADIDAAVDGAIQSKFRNAGQTCVCANRIYAQSGIYEIFVEKFARAAARLKVGDGAVEGTDIGPLIDERAIAKVEEHLADALSKGASLVDANCTAKADGCFFPPTVLRDVTAEMIVAREETFGPLAPVFRFDTEKEVIASANDSEYGLAAYFYTKDLARSWRVGEALEAGIVGVNSGTTSSVSAPFGGVKSSGLGREGSKYGIDDYLEIKYLCIGL